MATGPTHAECTGPVRITAVGDSITEAVGWCDVTERQQWLALLLERLGDDPVQQQPSRPGEYETIAGERYVVVNAGIGGDTTWQMRARFDGALRAQPADVVIVFGGSNDIEGGLPLAQSKDDLAWMVERCASQGIVPVMATVPPRSQMWGRRRADTLELNAWIRSHAAAHGYACIDFFDALESPDGSVSLPGSGAADYTDDGTHPNAAGNRAMADAIGLEPFTDAAARP